MVVFLDNNPGFYYYIRSSPRMTLTHGKRDTRVAIIGAGLDVIAIRSVDAVLVDFRVAGVAALEFLCERTDMWKVNPYSCFMSLISISTFFVTIVAMANLAVISRLTALKQFVGQVGHTVPGVDAALDLQKAS